MRWDARNTAIAALAVCLAGAAAIFLVVGGGTSSGESKPTSGEINGYLQFAKHAREYTLRIDRATEDPPEGSREIEREFRAFASGADYKANYLQVAVWPIGPVGVKAFGFQHSLLLYESTLRTVAKRARRGDPSLALPFRWVRQAGAEARAAGTAWERVLSAAIAD